MPNILHKTEQFNDAYWTIFDSLTVTPNTHAAPAFAGDGAGLADTLDDANAAGASSIFGTYETIANDSTDWVASFYVRKDAVTTRFPLFGLQFNFGTGLFAEVVLNTSTGAIVNGGNAPDASGVVDVDALWWRVWFRKANNGTGNTGARVYAYPAYSLLLDSSIDVTAVGSIVLWGAQLENASSVGTYVPEPFYAFANTDMNVVLGEPMVGGRIF